MGLYFKNELFHRGTPHQGPIPHSGRHPWGSGDNPYQRSASDFSVRVAELRSQGINNNTELARAMGMSTTEFREKISYEKEEQLAADRGRAMRLRDKGYSVAEVSRIMHVPDSTVRSWLKPSEIERQNITANTVDILKESVNKYGYVDVGDGTNIYLRISKQKLNSALRKLKDEEGYEVHSIKVPQMGNPGKYTWQKILCKPGTEWSEAKNNALKAMPIDGYSEDGGRTYTRLGLEFPESISSDRIFIRYGDKGGSEKDGVIELRRGLEDLNLKNSSYAQVRIAVDGTHYLKGMAMYSDNVPEGYDIIFNTNKNSDVEKDKVFKELKRDKVTGEIDRDNPFGATIKDVNKGGQYHYIGKDGKDHLSPINKVNEEGDWGEWSKTLASQMLSKQPKNLVKRQLDISLKEKQAEYEDIMSITNNVLKRKLLETFSDGCDAAAVHLKAAALPGQASHVILPITSMKDTEIFAPNYENGSKVVLIRYPHGGRFEIPELVVNNNNKEARSVIGPNAKDAVGINSKVAERLSGADFDGDTVLVIPNNSGAVKTANALNGLKNFDPKTSYPSFPGMRVIKPQEKQIEMGKVSNLITDMTLQGAPANDICLAVRHSMVVIDAEKHKLNWKQSEIDHNIAALKTKYQGGPNKGASTLISKAKSVEFVDARRDGYKIDPETGKKIYNKTGETYTNKDGKVVNRRMKSTKMAEHDNAFDLSSGTIIEDIYAQYANELKALGNKSRKNMIDISKTPREPTATATYRAEVESLNIKLNEALKNAPLERLAQRQANAVYDEKKKANPHMEDADKKKIKGQSLAAARNRVGAKKPKIVITEREWEAIQAKAISDTKLKTILNNTDLDELRKIAMPRNSKGLSNSKVALAKSMASAGYTLQEIAARLGVSTSTVSNALN